jgi:hypothetical protein
VLVSRYSALKLRFIGGSKHALRTRGEPDDRRVRFLKTLGGFVYRRADKESAAVVNFELAVRNDSPVSPRCRFDLPPLPWTA